MPLKLQKLQKSIILLYILDYLGYFINVNLQILKSEYSYKESQKSKKNSLQCKEHKNFSKIIKIKIIT